MKRHRLARRRRSQHHIVPTLHTLENRCLLTTYNAATPADLITDITAANASSVPVTINLTSLNYDLDNSASSQDPEDALPTYNNQGSSSSLTINGNGASLYTDSAFLDPKFVFRFMSITAGTLVVNNLRFYGGVTTSSGGALDISGGTVTLNNCTVTHNKAYGAADASTTGAGIAVRNATLNLNQTTLSDNSVETDDHIAVTTTGLVYTGQYQGVGLYAENSTVSITSSVINNNYAIHDLYGYPSIEDYPFGAEITDQGGGVYLSGGQANIVGSVISNNQVNAGSPQIAAAPGTPGGDDSKNEGTAGGTGGNGLNAQNAQGGGLYITNGSSLAAVQITNSQITGNTATGGLGLAGGQGGLGGSGGVSDLEQYGGDGGAGGAGGQGGSGGNAAGGGIYVDSGTVTIANSEINGSTVRGGSGGLGGRGGNGGDGSGAYTTPLGTHRTGGVGGAGGTGGAAGTGGQAIGGGIFVAAGQVSLINSTVANNTAQGGGGGAGTSGGFGGYYTGPITTPGAGGSGGNGGSATGGGLVVGLLGSLTTLNSTIADDAVNGGTGGAGGFPGVSYTSGHTPSGIGMVGTGGTAQGGGAISASGRLTLGNTLLASSSATVYTTTNGARFRPDSNGSLPASYSATTTASDLVGAVTSLGNNLITASDTVTGLNSTDQVGTSASPINAMLGPLANNGGPTQTIALLPGSPAINAGNNALAVDASGNPLTTDQRGVGYPRIFLGTVDIGAYEFTTPITLSVNRGSGQTAPGGSAFSGHLIAYAGAYGVPIAGLVVTFIAPASGASGTFSNGSNTIQVVTDSNGLADSGVFTANTTVGNYSVTATEPGGGSATFPETNSLVPTSFTQVGGSALLNGPIVLSAVLGAVASPLANQTVTFTLTASGAKYTATTNSLGVASVTAGTGTSSSGSYPFTVGYAGTSQYAATSASGLAPVAAYGAPVSLRLSTFPANFEVGVDQPTRFVVQVLDKNGNAVTGAVVSFAAPAAAGTFVGSTLATTNPNYGQAYAPDFIAGTTPGSYNVTASVVGYPSITPLTIPVSVQAVTTTTTVTLAGIQNGPGMLTAAVTDAPTGTSPVQGAVVKFYINGNRFQVLPFGQAVTNAAGVATLPYSIAANGPVTSVYATTFATTYLGQSETQGTISVLPSGAPVKFDFVQGTGQVVPAGSSFATPLQVQVVDAYGNAVGGDNVTFSVPNGQGLFLNGGVTTTDATGRATAPPFIAGTTTGPVLVTVADLNTPGVSATITETITAASPTLNGVTLTGIAHSTGTLTATLSTTAGTQIIPLVGQTVVFTINGTIVASAVTNSAGLATTTVPLAGVNVTSVTASFAGSGGYNATQTSGTNLLASSGAAALILTTGGSGHSVVVGSTVTTPFQALVTDLYGNPVTSASVTFTAPAGAGTFAGGFSSVTVLTNSSGLATTPSFQGGVGVGQFTINATVAGVSSPASFTLALTTTVAGSVGVAWGTSGTATLSMAADGLRLLPAGRSTDLPWSNIRQISITLGVAAPLSAVDVSVTGINMANYGPVTVTGSGTNYTITLAHPIAAADRVTVIIGNAGIATFTGRLDVLPGDVNDDGVVNIQDALIERNGYLGFGSVPVALIYLDILGDGSPDATNYNQIRKLIGTILP